MEHVFNPSLDRKGNSCLHERLCLAEHCVHCQELLLYGIQGVSAPSQSWDQTPMGTLFCCLCHSDLPILCRVTDILNSKGSPASEMPRAFICFISALPSQSWLAALIPSPTHTFSLQGGLRDGALCQVGNESPPNPKSLQRFAPLSSS